MKNNKKIVEQSTKVSAKAVGGPDKAAEMVKSLQSKGVQNVEVTEDELDPMDFNKGQSTQDPHQVGPSSNDGYGVDPGKTPGMYQDGMDEGEMTEKFESKSQQRYFFAKCKESGPKSKWCKMADEFASKTKNFKKLPEKVKESNQKIVENAIMKLVEKHISPRMTKGELLQTLSEQGIIRRPIKNNLFQSNSKMDKPIGKLYTSTKSDTMEQATKTKEKEAPTRVKPGTKEKPGTSDPFKNPKHQPKPKAKADVKEQGTKTAPPKVKPGTKEKPGTSDPFKNPKHQPKPKAELAINTFPKKASITKIPDYLEFDQLNINFKD
jgi:hypothetical protein